jgi:hypothetical protein
MTLTPLVPTLASTEAQALWTLQGTQTPATATDWSTPSGLSAGIGAGQRTPAHRVDDPTESPKR